MSCMEKGFPLSLFTCMAGASCVVGPIAYSQSDIVTEGRFGSPVPAAPPPDPPVLMKPPAPVPPPAAPPLPIPAAPVRVPPVPAPASLGVPEPELQPAAKMTASDQLPNPLSIAQ